MVLRVGRSRDGFTSFIELVFLAVEGSREVCMLEQDSQGVGNRIYLSPRALRRFEVTRCTQDGPC